MKKNLDPKIKNLEILSSVIEAEKKNNKSIVLCHGVFDLVHPGHIRHLNTASDQGDILVVSITSDRFVNKGPGRPVYAARLRAEILAALEQVDHVIINDNPSAVNIILSICPDIYVKGKDYSIPDNDITGKIIEESNAINKMGGSIYFTDEIVMSSSELLNAHFEVTRPETRRWLNKIKENFRVNEIIGYLSNISKKRVLVIGEAIVDEYCFCEGLGKSSKDPILAFQYCSSETHAGGSLAVANHIAGLTDTVGLLSVIGEINDSPSFVRDNLNSKINFHSLIQSGSPTIHKKRYIDNHTGSKVFELYTMDDGSLSMEMENKLLSLTESIIENYDIVIVADYGHGMISPKFINLLASKAKFLAVNTQANAGNRGYNTISKYPRADYVCLNGGEVELEARKRGSNLQNLILDMMNKIDCPNITVTMGRSGTLHYTRDKEFIEAPALATNVVDRVGAGDVVLAITSPLVELGVPWELVGFIGNLAAAEIVAELGTKRSLDMTSLVKHMEAILK